MNWEYNIVDDRDLLIVRAAGKFSVASFENMILEIYSDKRWSPGMDCLIDFSALDVSETGFVDILTATNIHKRYDTQIGPGRVAVVLGGEIHFGLGRLYETLLGSNVLATVKSFRTTDDARQWLAD
jgi:hypothetical protein